MSPAEIGRPIKDPRPNMTSEEKNLYLSAKLATGANSTRDITRIERYQSGTTTGWRVYYIDPNATTNPEE